MAVTKTSSEVLEDLRVETRSVLASVLRGASRVALLDVPWHRNFGDHLIHLAELEYLKQLGVEVAMESTLFGPIEAPLSKLHPEGPILLQAGGNFGDLWPIFQEWRESFVPAHADRQVVMLTNSMYFQTEANLRRAVDAFSQHPDLTLLMRDLRSVERASAAFSANTVVYCPDLALGCPIERLPAKPEVDVIMLRRSDRGGEPWRLPDGATSVTADWELEGRDDLMMRLLRQPDRVARRIASIAAAASGIRSASYLASSKICVRKAVETLSRGQVLVTDRMHAAVMGAMMGFDTVALDLKYDETRQGQVFGALHEQKISAAWECWMGQFPNVTLLREVDGVEQAVEGMLASQQLLH
jgi:exopolysaccharide biosynthesis predicted pyruvyltransferase EpsI